MSNDAESARPEIVMQEPGGVLVGRGECGQLARACLQEINRLAGLACAAKASFKATFHLKQPALDARPEQVASTFRSRIIDALQGGGKQGAGLSRPQPARSDLR